jgi:hypothetical protein
LKVILAKEPMMTIENETSEKKISEEREGREE